MASAKENRHKRILMFFFLLGFAFHSTLKRRKVFASSTISRYHSLNESGAELDGSITVFILRVLLIRLIGRLQPLSRSVSEALTKVNKIAIKSYE